MSFGGTNVLVRVIGYILEIHPQQEIRVLLGSGGGAAFGLVNSRVAA